MIKYIATEEQIKTLCLGLGETPLKYSLGLYKLVESFKKVETKDDGDEDGSKTN